MDLTLMTISSWLLLIFIGLSFFDGVYYHLWKFRLQERADSRFEHLTHTIRAVLFVPTVFLIYAIGVKGLLLWLVIGVLLIDLVAEVLDVINERKSRATIGGLSSSEYLVHVLLTTLRVSALTLAFSALPKEAWILQSTENLLLPAIAKSVAEFTLPGAILIALFHVYLIFDSHFVTRTEKMLKSFCCPMKMD